MPDPAFCAPHFPPAGSQPDLEQRGGENLNANGAVLWLHPAFPPPPMSILLKTASVLLALLLFPRGASAAFTLVRDGKPTACIVSSASAAAVAQPPAKGAKKPALETDEDLAVRTLVDWVKKITDAELPVSNKPMEGLAPIFVGNAARAAGLSLEDISHPGREGLRILAEEKRLLIGGQSEGATLKAVCRFLEELGCRYFMDSPLGEVFPRAQTLSTGNLNIAEKPGLLWRNPKGPSWGGRLWKAWNGAGGTPFNHAHSWGNYVRPADFATHPEFFALAADGQRKNNGWICTSNPAMREHFAAGVVRQIENGTLNPSLSPTDGRAYCQCEPCKALDDPKSLEPSSGTVCVTNRYVDFFDWIGRRVAQTHPESVLSFYCYADYTQPPTVRKKLSPNLCAMIAPIRYCRLHPLGHPGCPTREQQVEMIDGWAEIAKRIGYYSYMYNLADASLPMFKFSACAKEFPYLAKRGLTYATIEIVSNWHIYGPQIYLSLRLAYDPFADPTALMEDYWLRFYGAGAAPHMKAYWMGIDAAQQKLQTHAGSLFGLSQIYSPAFLEECESHLAKAAAAASANPMHAQRVALHAEGLRVARAYRTMSEAMARGDFSSAKKEFEGTLERIQPLKDQGLANREYGTSYLRRFLKAQVMEGAAALESAAPGTRPVVLPDKWRFAFDEDGTGIDKGFHTASLDDSKWREAATFSTTLDTQGLDKNTVFWYRTQITIPEVSGKHSLFFTEVDGKAEVFVNGQKIEIPEKYQNAKKALLPGAPQPREGTTKPRVPFELDVSAALKPGKNSVALRVDHTQITDLALGGILRPVLLIQKAP